MSGPGWSRISAALDAVLSAPLGERARVLEQATHGDPALRGEVESLLAAHDRSGQFLESSAAELAAPFLVDMRAEGASGEAAGHRIGPYRLLEELGHGGMGSVWLAERADGQFEQRVALKLIRRGMDSDEILSRFLRERQILARLEHPNIARLLDGGVSDSGRPYFVMEHVPGAPITRYADQQRLSVEGRLALFATVCRAVHHAHQNLIVHRDLKPSNVFVSDSGELKLLDFGVAKLLGDDSGDTGTGRLMTPEYASPEQAAGAPVATPSDVYQLGLLLYELLTGRRPYEVPPGAPGTVARIIHEAEPPPPSTAVTRPASRTRRDGTTEQIDIAAVSDRRSSTPERLRKRLRGDVDAIVLRALRQEPDRRYPSARDLAEDIERHLAHRPLRFGGSHWRHRGVKFVRRYRGRLAVAAVAAIGTAVMGTSWITQVREERTRAEREASKASEHAALLRRFFQGWSPEAAERGDVSAGVVLDGAARRAQAELVHDPESLAAILSTIGDLQLAVGRAGEAESLLVLALAVQEGLPGPPSLDLAGTLARLGRLQGENGEGPRAEASFRRALGIYSTLLPATRTEVLTAQFELARTLWDRQELREAESLLREALQNSPSPEAPVATEIAAALGYTLFLQARYDEAIAVLGPTLEQQRRVFGRVHLATLQTMRQLSSALRDQGHLEEAETLLLEALDISRVLLGEEHMQTGFALVTMALVLERKGEFVRAEPYAREALTLAERRFGQGHRFTAGVERTLGSVLLARGEGPAAEGVLRRARMGYEVNAPRDPDRGDVLNRLAWYLVSRQAPDAADHYREAVAFEGTLPPEGPFFVTDGFEYLAAAALQRGELALAERLFRRALALNQRQLPEGHPYRAMAVAGLGQTLLAGGRGVEAADYLREALVQWRQVRPAAPEQVALLKRQSAAAVAGAGLPPRR